MKALLVPTAWALWDKLIDTVPATVPTSDALVTVLEEAGKRQRAANEEAKTARGAAKLVGDGASAPPTAADIALAKERVIYSWTHDSVGVGEDGPTHQPIEHLASLRAMPGLRVVRPADGNETATAWAQAIEHQGPTALVLSRQDLPVLEGTAGNAGVRRGAYVLAELGPDEVDLPDLVLVATGSEVSLCVEAAATLAADDLRVRVVSMPCWEDFDEEDEAYQDEVLPGIVPTLAVEAGVTFGWDRWADEAIGIDRFGASAPGSTVLRELGMSVEHVVQVARELLDEIDV